MEHHISEVLISRRRADNLNAFAHAVWGSPEAVLKRDHRLGLHYIDMTTFPLAFEFLLGSSTVEYKKILVREEYETALAELETNDRYRHGAVVTGHPGIGKTFFLAYLLVACLGKCRPVAWQLNDEQYLMFRGTATLHSLNRIVLHEDCPIWALSDSNDQVRSPSSVFYHSMGVRAIQAALPKKPRWKEWSKQAGIECYIMDTWSVNEIGDLAKLLDLDVARMTALANSWGGVPRQLLRFLGMEENEIEEEYREAAPFAIQNCWEAPLEILDKNLDESLSNFYVCRPEQTKFGINRYFTSAVVPTPTVRRFLGDALREQHDAVRLGFFRALNRIDGTRETGGYIFESWFHIYISMAQSIRCHWVQGFGGVTPLTGTSTLVPPTWAGLKVAQPPCYWVAPKSALGIDGALILDKEIYVFQVTISSTHKTPIDDLKKLRDHLPVGLKDLDWRVVFIGDSKLIGAVAREWVGKLFFPMDQAMVIGWSKVDPVMLDVAYRELREEADPSDVLMEDAME